MMDLRGREKIVSLHGAILGGLFQQVRFLIELGADIDSRDNKGRTCLMLCSLIEDENWGVGLAMNFIEKGAKTHLRDKTGMNAFHYACLYQRPGMIRTLLAAADFDLAQQDKFGNTGLHYLVTVNNVDLTKTVVDAYNKYRMSVDKPNKEGVTPLIQAWLSDSFDCGRVLISLGHADQDIADTTYGKSAREWEIEALRRAEHIATVRANEAKQTVHQRLVRISSAPTRRRTRSNLDSKVLQAKLPTKQDNMIRSASLSDIRNNPQYVFKATPVDFFEKSTVRYQPSQRPRSSDFQRILDRRNQQKTWRPEFKFLFHEFEFQCSSTYVESAKPAPPELTASEFTPPPSDYGGETDRSVSARNKDHHHKEKLARKTSSSREPGKLGRSATRSDIFKGRRPSISPAGAPNGLLEPVPKPNVKKKTKSSTSSDLKEDGADGSDDVMENHEPKGLPPRPVSRVSMHKT